MVGLSILIQYHATDRVLSQGRFTVKLPHLLQNLYQIWVKPGYRVVVMSFLDEILCPSGFGL
jgi:hypothetical protein